MSWRDNLEAQGRGAAQTLTGGMNDELVARLMQAMPLDDKTGIPREYAGGQYEQYRDEQRANEADSQRKAPGNFAFGQVAGAVPATFATMAAGGLPAVGLGAAQGAVSGFGHSTASGKELAKDTARGSAIGGGLAAAGNAVLAAAPAMKALWRRGPPSGPAPALAGAHAGGSAPTTPKTPKTPSNVNMADGAARASKMVKASDGVRVPEDELAAHEAWLNGKDPPSQVGKTVRASKMVKASDGVRVPEDELAAHEAWLNGKDPPSQVVEKPLKKLPLESTNGASVDQMDDSTRARMFDNAKPLSLDDLNVAGKTRTVDPAALESARQQLGSMDPASFIGKGWARKVYDVDGQAQKIASGPRGILQNEAEVKTWNQVPEELRKSSVLNPVLSHAPDYSTVNQRMVTPLDEASLAKHTGLPEITDPDDNWLRQMAEPDFHGPQPTEPAQELQERMRRAFQEAPELDYRDVGKPSQWALDKRGKPVLIDYGFLKGMPLAIAGGAAAASQNRK